MVQFIIVFQEKTSYVATDRILFVLLLFLFVDFTAVEVNLTDSENEFPVPTVRADGDKWYLIGASLWITFIVTVHLCSLAKVKLWLSRVTVRLKNCISILSFLGIIF